MVVGAVVITLWWLGWLDRGGWGRCFHVTVVGVVQLRVPDGTATVLLAQVVSGTGLLGRLGLFEMMRSGGGAPPPHTHPD